MMIRKSFRMIVLMSICFVFAGSQLALGQVNLVQNWDFEDPTDAPWTMWVEGESAGAVATKGIDNTDSVTGNQSLLIEISAEGGDKRVELHQQPYVLSNGQKLTYAFWARTEAGKTRAARMISNERADPWTGYGSQEIEITDQWTEFWAPVEITADSTNVGIYVELKDTPAPVRIWFDHFRFYVGDYVAENLMDTATSVEPTSKISATWASIKAKL